MKKFALAILLVFSCGALVRAQQQQECFNPRRLLADPLSKNRAEWKDFEEFNPTVKPEGVVLLHRLKDGAGDKINLDFYSFTFQRPTDPNRTIETVFKQVREQFRRIVSGKPSSRGPTGLDFEPYAASKDPNDALFKRNKELWESDNPKGAMMSFTFKTVAPAHYLGLKKWTFVAEQGDVVVECATKVDFIFTTAYTKEHGQHPVSGNRGFGIMDKGDGIWTIYAKAADRESRSDVEIGGVNTYLGNFLLKKGLAPGIPGGEDAVFEQGHQFWLKFFPNLFEYLEEQGMKVNRESFTKNTCRHLYSPSPGPLPSPLLCPLSDPSLSPSLGPSARPSLVPSPGPSPGPSASPSVSPSPGSAASPSPTPLP